MGLNEILAEIPRLTASEREFLLSCLIEMGTAVDTDTTPEILAAIDAGKCSLETGPGASLEEARRRLGEWISK
jgi:hypothetical protein